MCIGLRVKYPLFVSEFNENPSFGSRIVPCGQTDKATDITKLLVVFRNFAKALKKGSYNNLLRLSVESIKTISVESIKTIFVESIKTISVESIKTISVESIKTISVESAQTRYFLTPGFHLFTFLQHVSVIPFICTREENPST